MSHIAFNPGSSFRGLHDSRVNYLVEGFGPVTDPEALAQTFARAIAAMDEGRPALVDVRVAGR
jgi:hypothetical protein